MKPTAKSKLIYIASPYTEGDVAVNVRVQMEAAHTIMDWGHVPIAPLLSHFLHIHRPRHYVDWLTCDLVIIPRVDILLRLPGESEGADIEVEHAQDNNVYVCESWLELKTYLLSKGLYNEPDSGECKIGHAGPSECH